MRNEIGRIHVPFDFYFNQIIRFFFRVAVAVEEEEFKKNM